MLKPISILQGSICRNRIWPWLWNTSRNAWRRTKAPRTASWRHYFSSNLPRHISILEWYWTNKVISRALWSFIRSHLKNSRKKITVSFLWKLRWIWQYAMRRTACEKKRWRCWWISKAFNQEVIWRTILGSYISEEGSMRRLRNITKRLWNLQLMVVWNRLISIHSTIWLSAWLKKTNMRNRWNIFKEHWNVFKHKLQLKISRNSSKSVAKSWTSTPTWP